MSDSEKVFILNSSTVKVSPYGHNSVREQGIEQTIPALKWTDSTFDATLRLNVFIRVRNSIVLLFE